LRPFASHAGRRRSKRSVATGYAWAGLLTAIGVANLGFAAYGDMALWVWFISVGAIGAKLAAIALQYAVFRTIVRRQLAQASA